MGELGTGAHVGLLAGAYQNKFRLGGKPLAGFGVSLREEPRRHAPVDRASAPAGSVHGFWRLLSAPAGHSGDRGVSGGLGLGPAVGLRLHSHQAHRH